MPIAVTCTCGRAMQIKEEFAGRKVRCPDCRGVVVVPTPEREADPEHDALEVLMAEPQVEEGRETKPYPSSVATRRSQPLRGEDKDEAGIQEAPRPRPPVDEPRPRRPEPARKPRPRVRRDDGPRVVVERGWFGNVNAGVVGGLLMMLLAAVWFFGGLAVGIIFFYPPILFIIGLVALFKGLSGNS
jgi:hypothetical protein